MVGRLIGYFEILDKLGEGGMGVVWKARDTRLNRLVALKVLPAGIVADQQRWQRLLREARAASALNHPNIATIYGISRDGGVDFITMEYVVGQTLDRVIPRHGLSISDTLKYAVQIADALAGAHAVGLVHRDLKPGNILINEEGTVKVVDFGLAKLSESIAPSEDDPTTQTIRQETGETEVVGTASYMSPEQATGKRVDTRSDIFAFGAVLYEMATGKRAFQGDSTVATLTAILHQQPRPLREAAPNASTDLEKLVMRCLRKDREWRFQHADDLKVSLADLREEYESKEHEATAAKTDEPAGHWKTWTVWVAAVVLLTAISWWVQVWNKSRAVPTGPPLIVLMDTSAPMGIYDSANRKNGRTNADDISDDLRDLPVALHKEMVGSAWDRDDQALIPIPDLIVIHLSSFFHAMNVDFQVGYPPFDDYAGTQSSEKSKQQSRSDLFVRLLDVAQNRLEAFLGYAGLANSKTKFLIYSRGRAGEWAEETYRRDWVQNAERRFPTLKGRVFTLNIEGGDKASFHDPKTVVQLRHSVESILRLSSAGTP